MSCAAGSRRHGNVRIHGEKTMFGISMQVEVLYIGKRETDKRPKGADR